MPDVHGTILMNLTMQDGRPRWKLAPLDNLPANAEILIIKTGALGDVLRTTTLLHPLKQKYPLARITWITAAAAVPLLAATNSLTNWWRWSRSRNSKRFSIVGLMP